MALLTACGGQSDDAGEGAVESGPSSTAGSTTTASGDRTYVGEATTADGYRYRVTLALGAPMGTAGECGPPPSPGRASVPVTLTVANQGADRPAPFPPLRIELVAAGRREPVNVRVPSGECTFVPRVAQVGAGESVTFAGATPLIDAAAGPGSAGNVEVAMSESGFSLVGPVP